MASSFEPTWCSPPGLTIRDVLHLKNLSVDRFAEALAVSRGAALGILSSEVPITGDLANRLAGVLGGSAAFWINREGQYQRDFERLQHAVSDHDAQSWLDDLPVADMVAFGWIRSHADIRKQFVECLRFFGVPDIKTWTQQYFDAIASYRFRSSPSLRSTYGAVVAWLRSGERLASQVDCAGWDKDQFREALQTIRGISRLKSPSRFVPKLTSVCGRCGVAVVIVRSPGGCRASGATRFLSRSRAMILMSFRYLSDDHFWFTFFHEAAHLILHDEQEIFLEGLGADTETETQADTFAESIIIPGRFREDFESLDPSYQNVMNFAKKLGLAPGLIVGQLQHYGRVPRNRLNRLKTRYRWS